MNRFRSSPMPERIIAQIAISPRRCVIIEDTPDSRIIRRCPLTPQGRAVLGSCDRGITIPKTVLLEFGIPLLDLDEPSSSVGRRAHG